MSKSFQQMKAESAILRDSKYVSQPSSKPDDTLGYNIYLEVHFLDNKEAKELGAKWDRIKKKWFIPPGISILKFCKFKPQI